MRRLTTSRARTGGRYRRILLYSCFAATLFRSIITEKSALSLYYFDLETRIEKKSIGFQDAIEMCVQTEFTLQTSSPQADNNTLYYPPPLPPIEATGVVKYRISQTPLYGEHRCEKNAVMAFACGYQLPQLINFISSLFKTGYDGDLVIGVGSDLTPETRSYLELLAADKQSGGNLVVYEVTLRCARKNLCKLDALLEEKKDGENSWKPLSDPRPFRQVAMIRYEYYWAWANRYSSNSVLFLADARDLYFQRNFMEEAEKSLFNASNDKKNKTLVVFEEPAPIRKSLANKNWVRNSYSPELLQELEDKMIICSGTTLGSQPSIETYTRAMVYEFDRQKCKKCGRTNDQGFHNYLVHKNKLLGANSQKISRVVVHSQGEGGIVNTVGLLPRMNDGKSLEELGLVKPDTKEILDNDHKTVSAVVHMYDRDASMKEWVDKQIQKELEEAIALLQTNKTNEDTN